MSEHSNAKDVPVLTDEGLLFSYLDKCLNANGADPQVVGYDSKGVPFVAWLDEEGGDCVGLRVSRLVVNDGGVTSSLAEVEAPAQGQASGLAYPVRILEYYIADPDREPEGDDLARREAALRRMPSTPGCCITSGVGVCDVHLAKTGDS